jgi:ectoine hydroxylase-related dioxygenase (phytanoyl-CoA dioxygenase family)
VALEHLDAQTSGEQIAEILARDGACIVDRVLDSGALARLRGELEPWVDATATGSDGFSGRRTRRTGGLVARSAAAREVVQHPLALAATKATLVGATSFHLHLTQVIAIGPGEPAQMIHRDQWAFDFFPFPKGYEVQCNTIWALTDFSEKTGATRVIPGSHRYDDGLKFEERDTIPAEMEKGSVLFYTGAIYHGGGANRSDETRWGLNITYARSWLRQEENQYLSVPHDVARELPEPLLRLIGYQRGAYALGYVDDLRDPIEVLKPAVEKQGFGDLAATRDAAASARSVRS